MLAPRVALVTGCRTGIGQATALRLHRAGLTVWATARDRASLGGLAAEGLHTLRLDVTDEESMRAAMAEITHAGPPVDVLVNSAGYGLPGPVEEVPLPAVRQQFETNVFGQTRLTQLVLPAMRARGGGTIVNLSSIFGRYAVPGGGFYHATKHAVEALSDAMRLEVAGFGVRVVLVQPGPVRTAFADTYVGHLDGGPTAYGDFNARCAEYFDAIYQGTRPTLAGRFVVSADDVAQVVERAVFSRRPHARYPVGFLARSTLALRRFAPDLLFDSQYVRRLFPVPRATTEEA